MTDSWVGQRMKNPKGEVGVVVDDKNGYNRTLFVRFKDGHVEQLLLSNTGENPYESQSWCWEYENEGTTEWVPWGY
jgi:hypothetical protein